MGIYYSIPNDADDARRAVREAASAVNTEEYKEVLLIYLGGNRNLLKFVIDGEVGRDYSGHTVLHRVRLDASKPEGWEAQVGHLLDPGSLVDSDCAPPGMAESPPGTHQDRLQKSIGVLFDIDALGGPSSYGTPCWQIIMKHLDLHQMPGVLFYQGDLEIQASQRPYCFCIAISEIVLLTGGRGYEYFIDKLSTASDAGLFPAGGRFANGSVTQLLIGTGRVDIDGRFRMSSQLGDFGDLRLVRSGRELGWQVLPDNDLIAPFALAYLSKSGGQGLPFSNETRLLCESVLRDIGQSLTLDALRGADLPEDQMRTACDRLVRQVWPDTQQVQAESASSASSSTQPRTKKWWEFWR